jgi:hypothetical protein
MDKGNIGVAVSIDLKKAFETVDHNILLNKIMRYGIKDNELKWSSHIYQMGLNAAMPMEFFQAAK